MADNLWDEEEPDCPHIEDRGVYRHCYLCGEEAPTFVVFVHNEGCHGQICRPCIRRIDALFGDEE